MNRSHVIPWLACALSVATIHASRADTSLSGSSGLLFVPTANVVANEHFSFGGVIADYQAFPAKQFSYFRDNVPSFYFAGYLTIGYIPRVEITIRGNGMPSTVGPGKTGPFYTDGMMCIQLLAYRGSGRVPSVAVGMQDTYGFMLFNALYGVATWAVPRENGTVVLSAGWAVDWYNKNQGTADDDWEVNHVLNGLLVGVEYPVVRRASALVEYDSRSFNVGMRFRPVPWCTFDVAAARWGLDRLARWSISGFAAQLHFNGSL